MMNYPLLSEYIEAIKSAEDNFDELSNLRPVLDSKGQPVMSGGNFAVVFKMKDEQTRKLYAVKCFLKEQEGRAEAYRMITRELENVVSSYLTPIKYLENELFVDSNATDETEFPVLLMDWVEGVTLDKYIREHINDEYELSLLVYHFSELAMWLMPQLFAHGDLKPDNILVQEGGKIVLVDYDGMFVPAMKGQKARELGSPDFRHPSRTENDFDEHIDDFSLVSILLSLKGIAHQPELLEQYGASDRLLFSEKDYRNISQCVLLKKLYPSKNSDLNVLLSLFILALEKKSLSEVSFRLFNLERPKEQKHEAFSTEVTDEDLANAWKDEFGVMYSEDGKKLLKATKNLKGLDYVIKEGVEIICDCALQLEGLHSITLSNTVHTIGALAFAKNDNLKFCNIPFSVRSICKNNPWGGCLKISQMDCRSLHFKMKDGILYSSDYRILYGLIYWKTNYISIDYRTKIISGNAFWSFGRSSNIKGVDLSNIIEIGNKAFFGCSDLTSITIPESVTSIGNWAFSECEGLTFITIPERVTRIGINPFAGCAFLKSIVVNQGNKLFDSRNNCNSIIRKDNNELIVGCRSSIIPKSVTSIGYSAFSGCNCLTSITIPESVTSIGDRAFLGCSSLTSIAIPESVTCIGDRAFFGCGSLTSITIPESVTSIGAEAFSWCSSLTSITIPESVISIGDEAFYGCNRLTNIFIPKGSKVKFKKLMSNYVNRFVEN